MTEHIKSNRIGRWIWAGVILTLAMMSVVAIRIQSQRRAIAALPISRHEYHETGPIGRVWDACGFERETLPWQPALKLLYLHSFSDEGLSDKQVKILADQHALEDLAFLDGCQMSRVAWEKLRALSDLREFAWYSAPIPGSLDVLPQHLSNLTISECGLTDVNSRMRTPFNCATADLSHNSLSAAALQIFDTDTLQSISLRSNPVGNDIFEVLRGFKNIRVVNLCDTLIEDRDLLDLSWVGQLEELNVSKTEVGDRFAGLIAQQPLKLLIIEQTAVSSFGVSQIFATGLVHELSVDERQLPIDEGSWTACKVSSINIKRRPLNEDRIERGPSWNRDDIAQELMEADDDSLREVGAVMRKCAPATMNFFINW